MATAAKPTTTHGTIRQGSSGPDVALWQSIVRVPVDGKFGPATDIATRKWQLAHGILSDGIVGAGTWTAALASLGATVVPAAVPAKSPSGEVTLPNAPPVPGVAITWNTSPVSPTAAVALPDVQIQPSGVKINLPAGNVITFPAVSATTAAPTATATSTPPSDSTVAVGAAVGALLGAGSAWWYASREAPRSEVEFGAVGALLGGLAGMYFAQARATAGA